MASIWAVCTAGFIHTILGLSIFLSQVPDGCSPAPQLASYIFSGTILLLLANLKLYSERYTHLPYSIQFLVETISALAILEFSDIYVWCRTERVIHNCARLLFLSLGMDPKVYLGKEYWILIVPTTALAASALFIVTRATQFM
ncbi:hypothetical protein KR200_005621, partial [Drosophila serrata]